MLINPVVIVKLLITFKMEMYTCQGKAPSTLLRKRILRLIGFLLKFLPEPMNLLIVSIKENFHILKTTKMFLVFFQEWRTNLRCQKENTQVETHLFQKQVDLLNKTWIRSLKRMILDLASMKCHPCSIDTPLHFDIFISIHFNVKLWTIRIKWKNQSFLNFSNTVFAEYTLFLSIQFISGSITSHQTNKHKYMKIGIKTRSLSIKLDSTVLISLVTL